MFDIYLALQVRFPKIVGQFIQSAEEAPRSIPPDIRALGTFKLSEMTMASSQKENERPTTTHIIQFSSDAYTKAVGNQLNALAQTG